MTMAPDTMDTYRSIMAELGHLKEAIGRIEGQMAGLGEQRTRAHEDHVACRAAVDKDLEVLTCKYDRLEEQLSRLVTWGRSLSIAGGLLVSVLTVINILLALGVKL